MTQAATAQELRDFMEWTGTTGRQSDTNLNLLLSWAHESLEKKTGRLITASASNTTRIFSTNGRAWVNIPDLRVVSSITLQSAPLTADASYWLTPSRNAPDIFVGVQVRAFSGDYRGNPEWFDRNLDRLWARGVSALPNDLSITGLWGWFQPPAQWKLATMALAAFGYQHADAIFSAARATPEGNIFDLATIPTEVRQLIDDWTIGDQAAAV